MAGEAEKAGWRARLLDRRSALAPAELDAAADALRRHVLDRLAGAPRVAAYVPIGREPGSLDLLDGLRDTGTEILLPVVLDGLDWAVYAGRDRLVRGSAGTLQPDGPLLGPEALVTATAVLVPALAVDARGVRLGRGGGYYDRALALLRPSVPVAALLHDGELVPRLPVDPWDRPVHAAVAPTAGWTELPVVEHHGV